MIQHVVTPPIFQHKGGFDYFFAIFHPYSQGKRSDFDTHRKSLNVLVNTINMNQHERCSMAMLVSGRVKLHLP